MAWQPRTSSSAETIHSEVEYIASNENNYLHFDFSVRYEPERSPRGPSTRSISGDGAAEVSNFCFSIEDLAGLVTCRVTPLEWILMDYSDASGMYPGPLRTLPSNDSYVSAACIPPPDIPRPRARAASSVPTYSPLYTSRCGRKPMHTSSRGPSPLPRTLLNLTLRGTRARALTAPRTSTATNTSHTTSATASSWRTSTRTPTTSSTPCRRRRSPTHTPTATPTATATATDSARKRRKRRAKHLRPVPFSRSRPWM